MIEIKKKIKKGRKNVSLDVFSWVNESPFKRIMSNKIEAIELVEYGYLQMLEIPGKDLNSMSNNEIQRTLRNYMDWLTKFTSGGTIYSTTLPTNTEAQINYQKHCLNTCRKDMKDCRNKRHYEQLLDREQLLLAHIQAEEQIRKEINNVEYILFLFADSVSDLEEISRKAQTYGNGDFVPQTISRWKKEQILEQFNNMNDRQ